MEGRKKSPQGSTRAVQVLNTIISLWLINASVSDYLTGTRADKKPAEADWMT